MNTYVLNAPAGINQFEASSGNQYTVSASGTITVSQADLSDALAAGFTQSFGGPTAIPVPVAQGGTGSAMGNGFANLQSAQSLLLPKFSAALNKSRAGLSSARVYCMGDSTTMGLYSNGTSSGNEYPLAWPTQLAKMLNGVGIVTSCDSFFTSLTPASDSRVTLGSGWGVNTGNTCIGGYPINASGTTGNYSFRPTSNVDTFVVWYLSQSYTGSFSYNVNGGTNTTVNTTTPGTGIGSVTVSATLGSNTINLNWVSGGAYIVGIEAYNSAAFPLRLVNAGASGFSTQNWADTSNPWSPLNVGGIKAFAPNLTIINLGINDWNYFGASGLAAFTTNMQNFITAAQQSGDVILVTPVPSAASSQTIAIQQQYINAIYSLAASNNLALIDLYTLFVSEAVSGALGLYGDNLVHPNGAGYAKIANAHAHLIGLV